jgi:hypothetical protein
MGNSKAVRTITRRSEVGIEIASAFVISQPHLAFAAIAAAVAAFAQVIPASIFRAEHANIT